jgi:hypothetical protein
MSKVIASAAVSHVTDETADYLRPRAGSPVLLDNPQIVNGDRVTHLHYRVSK